MFKEIIKSVGITILVFGAMIGLAIGICTLEAAIDKDTWNNGYCHCGGEFEFSNAAHRKNAGNYYYYNCQNCGYVIELTTQQVK